MRSTLSTRSTSSYAVAVARLVLASLLGVAVIAAQANEPEIRKPMPVTKAKRIRKLANENSAALAGGNYAHVVDLMYPALVEMAGDRGKMIDALRGDGAKGNGNIITTIEVSEPKEVVIVGKNEFAIVPV